MHFIHCPYCGNKLEKKEIGDDGLIPYCSNYNIPLWDMFTTCIIAAVVNNNKEITLLKQNYVSTTKYDDALQKLREGSIGWQLVKSVIKNSK